MLNRTDFILLASVNMPHWQPGERSAAKSSYSPFSMGRLACHFDFTEMRILSMAVE
jgi:hypothetical protein